MGENSSVAWTDHSWGPWRGCRKVSAGCDNCYAERDMKRYGKDHSKVVRASNATFFAPLKWQKKGLRGIVFTTPWSDFFIAEADAWRDEAWEVIRQCPDLIFAIVTNVMLIVTAENQEEADRRIPVLLGIKARLRGVSVEPMLGALDLKKDVGGTLWIGGDRGCAGQHQHRDSDARHNHGGSTQDSQAPRGVAHHHHDNRCHKGLDWVICGGESGPKARPMHPDWAISLRNQCAAAGVPFFFKQWGEWEPSFDFKRQFADIEPTTPVCRLAKDGFVGHSIAEMDGHERQCLMVRSGIKHAGRLLPDEEYLERPGVWV